MMYHIYIYRTDIVDKDAIGINIVNRAIRTNQEKHWEGWNADKRLMEFDVQAVQNQIIKKVGDRCKVDIKYPPSKFCQVAYLSIVTSYDMVRDVLVCAYSITEQEDLVLYDAEREETFYGDLVDNRFILLKRREEDIREYISLNYSSVYDYQKLYSCDTEKESAFVVTIKKTPDMNLEERVEAFYTILNNALIEGEQLICEYGYFKISSKLYSITLCLEINGKYSDRMGYYHKGNLGVHILKRMSCYEAFEWLKGCTDLEKSDTVARMTFLEMKRKYKNPANRFVQSVGMTKQLQNEVFDIRYSGWGYCGSEILFNIVPEDDLNNANGISTLKLEEETATFILPIIYDVYPYIYKRYWDKNYLPMEMWEDIIDKILETKELILNDTFNSKLKLYIEAFNLYVLSKDTRDEHYYESGEGYRIKHEPEKFLYEHRFDVAHLYDIFVEWSRAQIIHYSGWTDEMFNIEGP